MLTVLDLFSGIGGFSLGLERTGGLKTIAFCEIDPFCRQVLKKHWPEVPCHDDIRTLSLPAGFADVVAGGFPCQQTSVAASIHGRRTGLAGDTSGLFEEMARLIGQVKPRWALIENPSGIEEWTAEITRRLEALGYGVSRY